MTTRVIATSILAFCLSACGSPSSDSGAMLQSEKIGQALAGMKRSEEAYQSATKYQYILTQDLEIRGQHVGAVAWTGRGVIEIDFDFVNRSDLKTLTSTMLHEVCHIELQHYSFSFENESDAIDCQLLFMNQLYN